jgi:hypothetical protein
LKGENLKTNRPSKKLEHRRFGPFMVEKKVGKHTYRLKLPAQWKVHLVFQVVKLTPYTARSRPLHNPPPPDLVDDQLEQEIEDILDERVHRRWKQYLVKWKGFPMEESEWKTEGELQHAKEILDEFKLRHMTPAPCPKRGGNVRKPS